MNLQSLIALLLTFMIVATIWMAFTASKWGPWSENPLIIVINSAGSIALVIFAFLTLYYNSKPLATCSLAFYDKNNKTVDFVIENKGTNSIAECKVAYAILSTNEEQKITEIIAISKKKKSVRLFPQQALTYPLSDIDASKIKDHFHLLVLVETNFLLISTKYEHVFYWDKESERPFIFQDRENEKYKLIFDEFFKKMRRLK
ncbi:MAG: hypothetical protein PHI59_08560 [Candidatus Omnitrophica bacterium]|nr:hypothetical protein [Candidatus Omnitrophota bacterium]